MKRTLAAGTDRTLDAKLDLLARQMIGKSVVAGHGGGGRFVRRRGKTGLDAGNIGAEIFQAEGQLLVIDLFGASAKLRSLQPRNDKPEFVDLGFRPGKLGTLSGDLRGQLTHQGVQRTDVDWQRGEIEIHVCESNAIAKQ
jgi:hypothetical protein